MLKSEWLRTSPNPGSSRSLVVQREGIGGVWFVRISRCVLKGKLVRYSSVNPSINKLSSRIILHSPPYTYLGKQNQINGISVSASCRILYDCAK
jgi:hypothetical protein